LPTNEERVENIYRKYMHVICPYIVKYELMSNMFPDAILNEIRAVFTHLSKYYLSDDTLVKERNLQKAEGHIKRSILDCYKYICVAYEDKYTEFEKKYRRIDLSFVDNGEFLPQLLEARKNAIALMKDARESDFSIDSDGDKNLNEDYEKYEKAFVAYSSVYSLVEGSYRKLENIRKKAAFKDYLAIGGYAIGIIGAILSIVSFVL